MNVFYYVFREGCTPSSVKHTDIESATSLAERIANKHPGSIVYVLRSVCHFTTRQVERFDHDEMVNGCPVIRV